jgi:hypothetical protein
MRCRTETTRFGNEVVLRCAKFAIVKRVTPTCEVWDFESLLGKIDLLHEGTMKIILGGLIALLVFCLSGNAGDSKKPKYSIKEVMKEAHKSGLWKKIAAGDADKADREKLAELYKALNENRPPKGNVKEWKKTTSVMLKIAVEAIKDPAAGKKLKVNCGACHGKFKE